jgi:hypothetical protein
MWLILLESLNSGSKDRTDTSEFVIGTGMSSLVCLFDRLLHVENVSRDQTSLCHKQGLVAGFREVFDNPTIGNTVLHLDALQNKADKSIIFKLTTFVLKLPSQILALS